VEGQVFSSVGRVEERQRDTARAAGQQEVNEGKQSQDSALGGSAAASGALSIGSKCFSIPEQADVLLHKAFEAMKEPTDKAKQVAEEPRMNKGKELMDTDPYEKTSKPAAMIEGHESSRQARSGVTVARSLIVTVAKQKGTPLRSVMQRCIVIYVHCMITFGQGVLNSGLPS
jgi:hypothetical protein